MPELAQVALMVATEKEGAAPSNRGEERKSVQENAARKGGTFYSRWSSSLFREEPEVTVGDHVYQFARAIGAGTEQFDRKLALGADDLVRVEHVGLDVGDGYSTTANGITLAAALRRARIAYTQVGDLHGEVKRLTVMCADLGRDIGQRPDGCWHRCLVRLATDFKHTEVSANRDCGSKNCFLDLQVTLDGAGHNQVAAGQRAGISITFR